MGSCNVTCLAMALAYLGILYSSGAQLEDALYRSMETLGWDRHDPNHLKALVETFPGYKDIFCTNGRFHDIRTAEGIITRASSPGHHHQGIITRASPPSGLHRSGTGPVPQGPGGADQWKATLPPAPIPQAPQTASNLSCH